MPQELRFEIEERQGKELPKKCFMGIVYLWVSFQLNLDCRWIKEKVIYLVETGYKVNTRFPNLLILLIEQETT